MQRAQIRHDLFVKIARQETQRFAGFDCRAGQNDARDLPFPQRGERHGHRQIGLARAGRADADGHVVAPDRIEVFLLPDRFGGDAGFLLGGLDAVAQDVLEHRDAFVLNDVEGVGELAVAHGRARLEGILKQQKQVLGAVHGVGFAFQFDPAFARGGFDAELVFERLQIARVVVVELLRDAGVFEWRVSVGMEECGM